MIFTPKDHTWVVCAYGESPYLEACLASLQAQTVRSRIVISCGAPSHAVRETAERFGAELYAHHPMNSIGRDWNAAYNFACTPLVTLAHQDDLYEPDYTERMLQALNRSRDPILFFSNYWELRGGEKVSWTRNMRIKRMMLFPLRAKVLHNSIWIRRRILALGNPFCCPAATYVKGKCGESIFSETMKVSLDWDQWEKQSGKPGAFVYTKQRLMCHRVHPDSETTRMIANNIRGREDLEMYQRFWPDRMARRLARWYAASEKDNMIRKREDRKVSCHH